MGWLFNARTSRSKDWSEFKISIHAICSFRVNFDTLVCHVFLLSTWISFTEIVHIRCESLVCVCEIFGVCVCGVWCSIDGMWMFSIDTVHQFEIDTVRLMHTENYSEFRFASNKWNNNGLKRIIIIKICKKCLSFRLNRMFDYWLWCCVFKW